MICEWIWDEYVLLNQDCTAFTGIFRVSKCFWGSDFSEQMSNTFFILLVFLMNSSTKGQNKRNKYCKQVLEDRIIRTQLARLLILFALEVCPSASGFGPLRHQRWGEVEVLSVFLGFFHGGPRFSGDCIWRKISMKWTKLKLQNHSQIQALSKA